MARTATTGPSKQVQWLRTALVTAGRRIRVPTAGSRLHGRALIVARIVWLAVAALTCGLYIGGVWVWFGQIQKSCPPGLCVNGEVPPAVRHAFAALHLSISFYVWYNLVLNVLFAIGFATVAMVLFWRISHDPLALFVSLALLVFGLGAFEDGFLFSGLPSASPGWWLLVAALALMGEMAFGIFIVIFPDGRFVPRWTRLLVPVLALWWIPNIFFPGSPFDFATWPGVAYFGGWAVLLGIMGISQIYRYRSVSTPAQRLQTKWVVFGFVAAAVGYFAGQLVVYFLASPSLTSPVAVLANFIGYILAYAGILMIPITIAIAMLRHHLFDIDVIIRRTLIYGIVTATLGTIYAILSIVLQASFEAVTQQTSALAVVASTLAIAALFQPVRSRVQTVVDHRFYRRKFDAARTVAEFGQTLRSRVDLAQLTRDLLMVADETMQPGHVSLWLVHNEHEGELGAERYPGMVEADLAPIPKSVPLPDLFAAPDDGPTA